MSAMPVGGLVPRATEDAADLLVRNAGTHTGDPGRPRAEAIAVRDGVVTVVGDAPRRARLRTRTAPGRRAHARQGLAMPREQAARTPEGKRVRCVTHAF
ncbi:hypothetical protein GCM10010129_41760 [Streptomyces fumigatiscleroticus]|nr:hypothetical protein GCM10010129_41760 [Streptomyces fumigatiscleroticus]